MRWQLTVLVALVACGDDRDSVDLCELGQQTYFDALDALHEQAPRCTYDDECVRIETDVTCNGFSVALCGDFVHRDVASQWDPNRVCAQIEVEIVSRNLPAFVHCTSSTIGEEWVRWLPACVTVLELEGADEPTEEQAAKLADLKSSGYKIALRGPAAEALSEGFNVDPDPRVERGDQ